MSNISIDEIKEALRSRTRPIYDGVGIPPLHCVCIHNPSGRDVRIIAYSFVAGRVAAIWQFGDEFGYGLENDFSVDPDQVAP